MVMFHPWLQHVIRVVVYVLLSFQINTIANAQEPAPAPDYDPPTIDHDPAIPAATSGEAYTLTLVVTDNTAVKEVILHYKSPTDENYRSVSMQHRGADRYQVVLPPTDIMIPQMNYYIQAEDTAGNTVFRGARFSPLVLEVDVGVMALGAEVNDTQQKNVAIDSELSASSKPSHQGMSWTKILGGVLAVGLIASLVIDSDEPGSSLPPPTVPPALGTVLIDTAAP